MFGLYGLMAGVVSALPWLLTRYVGSFWACVCTSIAYGIISVAARLNDHIVIQLISLWFTAVWAWFAWLEWQKRKKLPRARKLGYKAKALLAKLVAGMPKARPRFNPAISGGRA